jgi:hypothetical protein
VLDEGFKAWQAHDFLLLRITPRITHQGKAGNVLAYHHIGRSNVKHEELNSIFAKIDDCDFVGAKAELHKLAQELAHKGELEYSDFLADYAYRSSRNFGNAQQTMPRSEIDKKFKALDQKYEDLVGKQDKILFDAYEYFKEHEKIATTTQSYRTSFSWFNIEHDDNFPFIDACMKNETQNHITLENVSTVFINQLKFYARLQKAGTTTLFNYGQRITNIEAGKFWRYVELRKNSMAQKNALDEIDVISEKLKELETQANEIRSYYWINDHSSTEFRNDFTECLEEFHKTQANS